MAGTKIGTTNHQPPTTNRLVIIGAAAWLGLLVAAPSLSAAPAAIIYGIGSLICHQRPERSFHLGAAQLPVCARCIGIYAGAALGAWGTLFTVVRAAARWNPRVLLLAGAMPIAVTLLIEWGGVGDPGNVVRALSGVVAGAGVALAVLTLHYDECAPRPPIAPSR